MSEGSSNTWKLVAAGCGIIALLGCCIGVLGITTCGVSLFGAPRELAHDFFTATRQGRFDDAHALTTNAFQVAHPRAGFGAELATVPASTTNTDVTVQNININNNLGQVSGTLTTPEGVVPFTLEIVSASEGYLINAITIGTTSLR